MAIPSDKALERLQTKLLVSDVRNKTDMALYEIIRDLIRYLRQTAVETDVAINGGGGGGGGGLANATYLTHTNQLPQLPNSKNLLAGTGIAFVDAAGTRTISATAVGDSVKFDSINIDFGATLCDYATVDVTGIAEILGGAKVFAWIQGDTTVDSDEEDHIQAIYNMNVVAAAIVPTVGFTIHAFVVQGLTKGLYKVQYLWSNG